MFIQILNNRGGFGTDAQTLLEGCQANYTNFLEDVQSTIEYIGNTFTENICLYAKGGSASLISFLLSTRYPTMLTGTVLHVLIN